MTTHFRLLVVLMALAGTVSLAGCDSTDSLDPRAIYRIEVEWDASPDDLDSHLTGPDGSGGRFHVYFSNPLVDNHELEEDFTDGPGPEVVRFAPNARDGLYRFSVHNFSDQSASGAQGMVDLNTEVRLIADGSTIRTFRATNATSGNTWRVFEMEIDGNDVTINPGSGSSGLGYFTADSAGDTGVFLTGGDGSPVVKE
jgi:hypothetical protein